MFKRASIKLLSTFSCADSHYRGLVRETLFAVFSLAISLSLISRMQASALSSIADLVLNREYDWTRDPMTDKSPRRGNREEEKLLSYVGRIGVCPASIPASRVTSDTINGPRFPDVPYNTRSAEDNPTLSQSFSFPSCRPSNPRYLVTRELNQV
jgi:hypothetical protein